MSEAPKRPALAPWRPTPGQVVLFVAGVLLVMPAVAGFLYIKVIRGNVIDQVKTLAVLAVPIVGFIGGTASYFFRRKKAPRNE